MINDNPLSTPAELVPIAVVEATRALLWVQTAADACRIAEELVRGLGGSVLPATSRDTSALPADITFGEGEPLLAAADPGTTARALLDRHLTPFLLDARRALQLSGRTERLAEDASTDALTGLPNRRMLYRALGRLSADETVIMLDLDHFKRINDELGHPAGDDVLRSFGKVLHANVRGRDFVGRFGGEEFVVILSPPHSVESFLGRLREEWSARRPLPVTFSAGSCHFVTDSNTTLRLADEALYEAKDAGRDRWIPSTGAMDVNSESSDR